MSFFKYRIKYNFYDNSKIFLKFEAFVEEALVDHRNQIGPLERWQPLIKSSE